MNIVLYNYVCVYAYETKIDQHLMTIYILKALLR